MEDSAAFSFIDPQGRQPAWVQFWYGEPLSDLDTLIQHAFFQAELMHVLVVLGRPCEQQSKALQRMLAADGREAGLHSNALWTARGIALLCFALLYKSDSTS